MDQSLDPVAVARALKRPRRHHYPKAPETETLQLEVQKLKSDIANLATQLEEAKKEAEAARQELQNLKAASTKGGKKAKQQNKPEEPIETIELEDEPEGAEQPANIAAHHEQHETTDSGREGQPLTQGP